MDSSMETPECIQTQNFTYQRDPYSAGGFQVLHNQKRMSPEEHVAATNAFESQQHSVERRYSQSFSYSQSRPSTPAPSQNQSPQYSPNPFGPHLSDSAMKAMAPPPQFNQNYVMSPHHGHPPTYQLPTQYHHQHQQAVTPNAPLQQQPPMPPQLHSPQLGPGGYPNHLNVQQGFNAPGHVSPYAPPNSGGVPVHQQTYPMPQPYTPQMPSFPQPPSPGATPPPPFATGPAMSQFNAQPPFPRAFSPQEISYTQSVDTLPSERRASVSFDNSMQSPKRRVSNGLQTDFMLSPGERPPMDSNNTTQPPTANNSRRQSLSAQGVNTPGSRRGSGQSERRGRRHSDSMEVAETSVTQEELDAAWAKIDEIRLETCDNKVMRALAKMDCQQRKAMVHALASDTDTMLHLCMHEKGAVLRHLMESFSGTEVCSPIIDFIMTNGMVVARDKCGCVAFKHFYDHASDTGRTKLDTLVQLNFIELANDAFGNFVIQHICAKRNPAALNSFAKILADDVVMTTVSGSKYGSHSVEAFFQHAPAHNIESVMRYLIQSDTSMVHLTQHNYGNYVLQKAMRRVSMISQQRDGDLRHQCITALKPYLAESKHAQNIVKSFYKPSHTPHPHHQPHHRPVRPPHREMAQQ